MLCGVNNTVLVFKPRQVLLAAKVMKHGKENGSASADEVLSLDSDQKASLLRCVARFLKANGFSKTLKKFLAEAEIEKDAVDGALLDLEELYSKFVNKCEDSNIKVKSQSEQDGQVVGDKVEVVEKQAEELSKHGKEKTKKKKKNNITSEPETVPGSTAEKSNDKLAEEKSTKSKTKKKKGDLEDTNITSNERDDSHTSDAEAAEQDSKGVKKRKRTVSDENGLTPADTTAIEESKRRKVDVTHSNASLGTTHKTDDLQSNSTDQLNKLENGSIDKSATKSSAQKSSKKQRNGSTEPKSVTAFKRVKEEEVVFTDERLKDNSYWAKDGAEIGYGAKAQEVLGQVRGRDFRHEKTKKKRGSYRGGQIDLQSHSVKFNYSDEE